MLYGVSVRSLEIKDLLQLLDFIHQLGYYKVDDTKSDYPSTTAMIDQIVDKMMDNLENLSNFDKVDLDAVF